MRRTMITTTVLLAAVAAWWLLGHWIPGPSERFYLLVPPVFLTLFCLRSPDGWKALKPHLPMAFRYLAVLFIGVVVYSCGLLLSLEMLPLLSVNSIWSWVPEAFLAVYFLFGVSLVLMAILLILRTAVRGMDRLLFGPLPAEEVKWPPLRTLWFDLAPLVLLVPIALPYLLATMYIHRIKLPNLEPSVMLGNRPFEDVEFTTVDGLTLRGWFFPALEPSSERTLLICHGIAVNRSPCLAHLEVADALKAHALLFDFRGHGASDGHTVTVGHREQLDVEAAVAYLRRHRSEQSRELFGLGLSMGTAGLIRAAANVEPPFHALIIDSGYVSAVELTDHVLNAFPTVMRPCLTGPGIPLASLEAGCWLPDMRPVDQIHRIRAPVLFIHSRGDAIIPLSHGQRLYENALEPKALWVADVEFHGSAFFYAKSDYLRHIRQFVEGETTSR